MKGLLDRVLMGVEWGEVRFRKYVLLFVWLMLFGNFGKLLIMIFIWFCFGLIS